MNHSSVFASSLATVLILSACSQNAEPVVSPESVSEPEIAADPTVLPRSASAAGASVFFITPADGDTVSNPISIEFGIDGMDIVKAGVEQPSSGHHHLMIDTDLPDFSLPIPADGQHVHFGDGSTATEITLPPGQHTLQMLLGDHFHIPHDPALVSEPITITVE
ncbi:MAG: DUF4399 domain-containing protein [Proteobacteria bacterium]|nr:DUF4399 domain-containing protein [Pseudomonadota bacterium]